MATDTVTEAAVRRLERSGLHGLADAVAAAPAGTVKACYRLPARTKLVAQVMAAQEGTTLTAILTRALEDYIHRR